MVFFTYEKSLLLPTRSNWRSLRKEISINTSQRLTTHFFEMESRFDNTYSTFPNNSSVNSLLSKHVCTTQIIRYSYMKCITGILTWFLYIYTSNAGLIEKVWVTWNHVTFWAIYKKGKYLVNTSILCWEKLSLRLKIWKYSYMKYFTGKRT